MFYFGSVKWSSVMSAQIKICVIVTRFSRRRGFQPMTPRRILIDTDPGVDDAVAILLALASPELHVAGLVAVAGNLGLAITERNARAICALAGRPDIPVFAGCSRPITRPPITAEYFHGESGLGTLALPPPRMPLQATHGVD